MQSTKRIKLLTVIIYHCQHLNVKANKKPVYSAHYLYRQNLYRFFSYIDMFYQVQIFPLFDVTGGVVG